MAKRRGEKKAALPVPDRARGVPLGREARMAVENLRLYGANPDCVPRPGIDDDAAQQHWFQTRSAAGWEKKRVPLWVADLAAAVLQQIPVRHDRPRGRPRDAATDELEFWLMGGGSVDENARWTETLRARREESQPTMRT